MLRTFNIGRIIRPTANVSVEHNGIWRTRDVRHPVVSGRDLARAVVVQVQPVVDLRRRERPGFGQRQRRVGKRTVRKRRAFVVVAGGPIYIVLSYCHGSPQPIRVFAQCLFCAILLVTEAYMKIFLNGKAATDGMFMQIDDCDADLTKTTWFYSSNGYAYGRWPRQSNGRPRSASRIVLERIVGRKLERSEIPDHINHDKLDNRRDNLRLCTQAENSRNSVKRTWSNGKQPTSRYKGVSLHRQSGKWRAQLYIDHKLYCLGYHATEEQAARAYDAAAREHFDEFAYLNFPE